MSLPFSDADLQLLQERVRRAEANTSGEIVVFVLPRSGAYEAVLWRGASLGVLCAVVLWVVLSFTLTTWGVQWLWAPGFLIGLMGIGAAAGVALVRWNGAAFRFVAGKNLAARAVRRRAESVFLNEGVFETEQRTGLLLFVSMLERRIEILADRGISDAVSPERWEEIVELVRPKLRRGEVAQALADGITACGDVLRSSGLEPADEDRNELADDVRFGTD